MDSVDRQDELDLLRERLRQMTADMHTILEMAERPDQVDADTTLKQVLEIAEKALAK